jgi:RNA polymerase sigma-70 factor (ECF subfamily)
VTVDESLYAELRPAAFAVAYRMLGSVAEAEDAVQDGLIRLHRALEDGEEIAAPRAYLSTVITRICIDRLRSARVRREQYVGEWLPEPLVEADEVDDPAAHAEMADSLSLAFLALLERLSPEQRAAFLLREVFDYPYDRIAGIVGTSEANARQLVARARRHVAERRPRFEASRERRERLADGFFAAAERGDLAALEQLLAHDVELHGDGGGKVPALAQVLRGRSRVARTLVNWGRFATRIEGFSMRRVEVNGQPGALLLDGRGDLLGVMALDIADGRIQSVRSIANPEKLGHLGTVSELPQRGYRPS